MFQYFLKIKSKLVIDSWYTTKTGQLGTALYETTVSDVTASLEGLFTSTTQRLRCVFKMIDFLF